MIYIKCIYMHALLREYLYLHNSFKRQGKHFNWCIMDSIISYYTSYDITFPIYIYLKQSHMHVLYTFISVPLFGIKYVDT